MLRQNQCLIIVGVLFALVGIGILVVGLYVTPKELPNIFEQKVNAYVVVDSEKAEGYKGWAGQNDVDNPYYLVVYMFNLTNMEEVISSSAVPAYEQVGPYMFRRYRKSENVSFSDNGALVQYNDFVDFYFDQEASGTLSDSDLFTNINPVIVGALMQAVQPGGQNTGETNMVLAATGGMIQSFTNYFTGPFVSLFTAYKFPSFFGPIMNATIEALNTTSSEGYDVFIDTWRNGTTSPSLGNWTGLLLNGNTPANISVYSAQLLLNSTEPFSLLDPSPQAAWYWDQAMTNSSLAQALVVKFDITVEQIQIIWNWRNSVFGPLRMYPTLISQYGLDEISDIGWVQWANQAPLDGQSITIFPYIGEYGIYASVELNSNDATWREWRAIMDPNTGLENITNIQAFLQLFGMNQTGNFAPWGLNATTGMDLGLYVLQLAENQGVPAILANVGPTGGLFVTKSVNEWTFNCNDYMLNLLRENPPLCSFRYNHTSMAPNVVRTGKSDINTINNYVSWEGQTQVDFYQSPMNVSAFTELGQFVPKHNKHEPYPVWQQNTARIIYLNYTGNTTVQGIAADRYILDFEKTFGISTYFEQSIYGLANLTNVESGSPIFVSLWDMLYVDETIANVTGLNATNEWDDNTIIDIEPTTGITIQARRRMQVNVFVPNENAEWFGSGDSASSIFGNQLFTSGIAYPLAKIGEYATISSGSAETLRDKLKLASHVRHITFYVGVIAGPLMIVLGLCLIFLARRRHMNHRHYRGERASLISH